MSDTGDRDAMPPALDAEWVAFPGGELEGRRPRLRCAACREAEQAGTPAGEGRRLCFECYRADFERRRAIGAVLSRAISPFETVDRDGAASRDPNRDPNRDPSRDNIRYFHVPPTPADRDPRYAALARRRRQAQRAARRALAEPVVDLEQFPESWRPFVRIAINA